MQQFKLYEDMLLERKKEILNIVENLKKEMGYVDSCDIKEEADFATCSNNNENNYLIYIQQMKELKEIEEALLRIKKKTYGICEMCEEEIDPERLAVKPFAKYCIDCRELIEKERAQ